MSIFVMYMIWFVYFELEVKIWHPIVYGRPVHLKDGVYYSASAVLSQLPFYWLTTLSWDVSRDCALNVLMGEPLEVN